MDKLSVMNAFCRIVERESFVRAAEDLGVSPALLSRELKLLEESLGSSLITRTTRSMALTDHGRLFYQEAQTILASVAGIENRIREHAGTVRGHLRVNAPNSFGQMVISPMLPGFARDFPDLSVTLSFDDHVIDMVEGGFDLSIRIRASLPDSALVARRIGSVGQYLFAAPAYLERAGTPQSPEDLKTHDTLGFQLADHVSHWPLTGPDGSTEIDIAPRIRVGSSLVLLDLITAGLGIGTLPDFVSGPAEARGDIIRVLPEHALPERHVFAVTASRLGSDAKVTAFLEHLRQHIGGKSA